MGEVKVSSNASQTITSVRGSPNLVGGGGRTYKAINVRPEMSFVILEQRLFGAEPVPL